MTNPDDTSAGVTPVIFRQLHIKLPTPAFTEPASKHKGSNAWLKKHPQGFLLMHNLKPSYPMGKSMLVQSIDTDELLVNKRFKREAPTFKEDDREFQNPKRDILYWTPSPPELRFSTLQDPRVEAQLPNEPYFPKLHAYSGPPELEEEDELDESDIYSLYFQHYNGGTLSNLMERYSDRRIGSPVPESFIWHVMEQLSRAILHLHCGYSNADMDYHYYRSASDKVQSWPNKRKWKRIVHRAITPQNVLLHFPDGDDPVEHCFPQIILEGFDKAGFISDDRERWGQGTISNRGEEAEIGPSGFEDIHLFGELLRRLVTVYDGGKNDRESRLDYDVNVEGRLSPYLSKTLKLRAGQERAYSSDLINLLKKWEIPALQKGDGARFPHLGVHEQIKNVFFLRDEVLPMAIKKVGEYIEKWSEDPVLQTPVPERDDFGDVSWVKPAPDFEMIPYSTTRYREEKILEQYKKELRWLFGPYVPVWYRYDAVGVDNIPATAERVYTVTEKLDAEGGDKAGTEGDQTNDEAAQAGEAKIAKAARLKTAEATEARAVEAAQAREAEATQAREAEATRARAAKEAEASEAEETRVREAEEAQARAVAAAQLKAAEDEAAEVKAAKEAEAKAAEAAQAKPAKDAQAKAVEEAAAEGTRASRPLDKPPPPKSRRIMTRAVTKATTKAESEADTEADDTEDAAPAATKPAAKAKAKPAPKPKTTTKPPPKPKAAPKPKPAPKPKSAPKPKAKRPAKPTAKPISPAPIDLETVTTGTQVSPSLQFRRSVQERVREALEVLEQVADELDRAVAWQRREQQREREGEGGAGVGEDLNVDMDGLLKGLRRVVDGGWLAQAGLRAARRGMRRGQGGVGDGGEDDGGDEGQSEGRGKVKVKVEEDTMETEGVERGVHGGNGVDEGAGQGAVGPRRTGRKRKLPDRF